MSYLVSILRTDEKKELSISQRELLDLVSKEDRLSVIKSGSESIELALAFHGEESVLLVWQKGRVWTKNPSAQTITYMISIAGKLEARVRGDEFETYTSAEETYIHPFDQKELFKLRGKYHVDEKGNSKRLVYSVLVLSLFFFMGFLMSKCS